MITRGVLLFQPMPYALLRHHVHNSVLIFHTARSIQAHDIAAHAPDVFPVGVEEDPPAIWRRRGKWDAQKARRKEYSGAYYRGHRIQGVHRRLQAERSVLGGEYEVISEPRNEVGMLTRR